MVKIKVALKLFGDQNRSFQVVPHMKRVPSTFKAVKSVLTTFSYSEVAFSMICFCLVLSNKMVVLGLKFKKSKRTD